MRKCLVVGAVVLAAAACNAFDSDAPSPVTTVDASTDASAPAPGDGASAAPGIESGTDAGPSPPPFCDGRGARLCADFEPGGATERQWTKILDTPETKGAGVPADIMLSNEPERGYVYVTRFTGGYMGADSSLSRRTHHDRAPNNWTTGIDAREYEVKIKIVASSGNDDPVGLLGWNGDDVTPHAVLVSCRDEKDECALSVARDTATVTAGLTIPKNKWTRLVVNIPPTTYTGSGNDEPADVVLTVEVLGQAKKGTTVTFVGVTCPAPKKQRVDLGIGSLKPTRGAWEVWYDDLALTY